VFRLTCGIPAITKAQDMDEITSLDRFKAPLGGQEIELQQVAHEAGGLHMLRIRIRERSRFTVFEIDAGTATRWGQALLLWAQQQAPDAGSP
jgi:hypothetical protein